MDCVSMDIEILNVGGENRQGIGNVTLMCMLEHVRESMHACVRHWLVHAYKSFQHSVRVCDRKYSRLNIDLNEIY